jgi:flagellar hook-length control protein FliK
MAALIASLADPQAPAAPAPASVGDASLFALTMNQPASVAATATPAQMLSDLTEVAIDVPLDHADFAEAFAKQSASLVVQGSSNAEILLNPRDMGPIRIAISMDADAASLEIAADHAQTRAAIEASMPALRQMLADQGVRLADWKVDSPAAAGERQQPAAGDGSRQQPHQPQPQAASTPGHGSQAAGSGSGSLRGDDAGRAGSARADGWRGAASAPTDGVAGGANGSRIDLYA